MNYLALVELFTFNLCFLDLYCTSPYPNIIMQPVWVFRSGTNPYTAYTHVNSCMSLYSPIISLSLNVSDGNCSTSLNFNYYYTVLLVTLVHMIDSFCCVLVSVYWCILVTGVNLGFYPVYLLHVFIFFFYGIIPDSGAFLVI